MCPASPLVETAAGNKLDPLDQAAARELQTKYVTLLGELDVRFGLGTHAILDFRAEGKSWEEIALIVPLSVKTCWNRHKKATEWLCKGLSLPLPKGEQHE